MHFKITTLCENTVPISIGLVGEHGLSFLIEGPDHVILFDTGQGLGLARNAVKLGKDLGHVDHVVLSHGHYDHTGGLEAVFEASPGVTLVAHPDVFDEKMGVLPGAAPLPIGLPLTRGIVARRTNMVLTREPHRIGQGARTTGEVPMTTSWESVDQGLYVRTPEGLKKDEVLDDLALVLDSETGPVVVVGCSHRGIINILRAVRKLTGSDRIRAVLGGMHLQRASDRQLEETIRAFGTYGIEKLVMSHCTGLEASARIREAIGDKVLFNRVGAVFEF